MKDPLCEEITERVICSLLSICLCGLEGLCQLIRAGSGLHAALDAFYTGDGFVNIHAFCQCRDTFQIAIAATDELNVLDLVILNIKIDHLRAGSFGFVLVHIKIPFCS